jgi:hypothetical protein
MHGRAEACTKEEERANSSRHSLQQIGDQTSFRAKKKGYPLELQ